jgi:hypothetical protein
MEGLNLPREKTLVLGLPCPGLLHLRLKEFRDAPKLLKL